MSLVRGAKRGHETLTGYWKLPEVLGDGLIADGIDGVYSFLGRTRMA